MNPFIHAKWVSAEESDFAPIILKKFNAVKGERAVINISGLGFYELFINGERVGEDFYKPAVSDYAPRDFSRYTYPLSDKTSHRVYYNSYDISKYLKNGENTLAVMLGKGYYCQKKRLAEGDTSFGERLRCIFEITFRENRKVYSDGSEKVAESFIKSDNLFYGETQDYADFADFSSGCFKVVSNVKVEEYPEKLYRQRCPSDGIIRKIKPIFIGTDGNRKIYDAGEEISGVVALKTLSDKVIVRHGEKLENGKINFDTSSGYSDQISTDIYLNARNRKKVFPIFNWSGFRYFDVEGEAEDIEVFVIHSRVRQTATFECGNKTLEWLFNAYIRTELINMHSGVPMDCPHRERLGYTGDGQLTAETAMLYLSGGSFYEKWIADIADCQDISTGHIQHTAPFFGGGGGPGGWGSAIVEVPYAYYKVCGDKRILKKYYRNMLRYLDCMQGFCENNLVVKERDGGWCLGDWCTPEDVAIPEPFVNTYYYVKSMRQVEKIAEIIGEKVDYSKETERCLAAMKREYYDEKSGDFCGGIQAANAFAILIGLGDERTKKNLIGKYSETKTLDTGMFGTDVLAEALVILGRTDILVEILSGDKKPSLGYMKANGATTIWEGWSGYGSMAHPMQGACVKQFLYGLLGVSGDAGFKNITVKPEFIDKLGYIKAKIKLGGGVVKFDYVYENGRVKANIEKKGDINVKLIKGDTYAE